MKVGIVGAGVTGLTAAYQLGKQGHQVTVYETEAIAGGLSSGFHVPEWKWTLDRFYRHVFAGDRAIIALAKELEVPLTFTRPVTSLWVNGHPYPYDSPIAAALYPNLPFHLNIRVGMVIAYLKYIVRHGTYLEHTTADAWLRRTMGERAYRELWEPMLRGKFKDHFDQVNMAWFWARVYKRTPRLGTFVGGFQAFFDALADRIRAQGGVILLNTPVQGIAPVEGGGLRLTTPEGQFTYDAVAATVGPGLMARLAPDLPPGYLGQLLKLKSMGAIALILALERQLMERTYWLNLPARSPDQRENEFPFMALVEHTNYIPAEHYGGEHLVYCGDYISPDHRYFEMSQEELLATFLPSLKKVNPAFEASWVRRSWLFRARYAQPVPPVNHSGSIPAQRTPIRGLYYASMSQVYPWDRGTNYAAEMGRQVAEMVHKDVGRRTEDE